MIEMRALAVVLLCLPTAIVAAEEIPLRTAVDATFAPHAFPDFTGGVQGFNVDLANEIGKRLRRKIQIQVMPIDTVWGHTGGGGTDGVANRYLNRAIGAFLKSLDDPMDGRR